MMKLTFEWDEAKAKLNVSKHNIGFEEGRTIFNDPMLLTYADTEHNEHEKRFINIGLSITGRVLVLIHTERYGRIRIISCRKATGSERKRYEED